MLLAPTLGAAVIADVRRHGEGEHSARLKLAEQPIDMREVRLVGGGPIVHVGEGHVALGVGPGRRVVRERGLDHAEEDRVEASLEHDRRDTGSCPPLRVPRRSTSTVALDQERPSTCVDEISSICRHHEREDRGGQVHVPWWAGVRRDAAGPRTVARSDMRRIGLACPDIASNRRDRDDHNEGGEARFHWLPRRATDPLVMVRHATRASSTDIGFGDASSEVTAATPAGPEFLNAANDSSTPESTPFILSNPVRIAVVSNVGNLNLGDEAILRSTLQALRNRLPNASIRVYTISPAEAAERHGVDTAPLRSRVTERPAGNPTEPRTPFGPLPASDRRADPGCGCPPHPCCGSGRTRTGLHRSLLALAMRGADLLLVAGSNQLEDWFGGPRGYPYTLLLWTILARLVGAPVAFVSVGAGPLNSGLSRWMCVRAVRLATYVSFRDAESLGLMRRLGYHRGGIVVPDLAFGLALEDPRARPSGASLRIGVNVFPYRDPRYDPHVRDGGAAFCRIPRWDRRRGRRRPATWHAAGAVRNAAGG